MHFLTAHFSAHSNTNVRQRVCNFGAFLVRAMPCDKWLGVGRFFSFLRILETKKTSWRVSCPPVPISQASQPANSKKQKCLTVNVLLRGAWAGQRPGSNPVAHGRYLEVNEQELAPYRPCARIFQHAFSVHFSPRIFLHTPSARKSAQMCS